jgi:hypothetical protein
MEVWVILTVIFGVITVLGICAGKIREEDINDDKTVSGLLTSIGSIGFAVFGMFTMLCILG